MSSLTEKERNYLATLFEARMEKLAPYAIASLMELEEMHIICFKLGITIDSLDIINKDFIEGSVFAPD